MKYIPGGTAMENKNVLIIDDDERVRQAYVHILSPCAVNQELESRGRTLFGEDQPSSANNPAGFEVTTAGTGQQGIEAVRCGLARKKRFAAAFIDMKMPSLNGAETARRIWELDPQIKIVIVTAFSEYSPEDIIRIIGRKDLLYLRKPFNSEEIRQLAVALTQQWNMEQERDRSCKELKKAHNQIAAINQNLKELVHQRTAQLIQAEKMVSIGTLAAGVAHEINNPFACINANVGTMGEYVAKVRELLSHLKGLETDGNSPPMEDAGDQLKVLKEFIQQEEFDYILADIDDLVGECRHSVQRVKRIVDALRSFSQPGQEGKQRVSVHDILEDTIEVAWNSIKDTADVVKEYETDLPMIDCNRQNLGQVFMNLMMNAIQAIEDRGTIKIQTRRIKSLGLNMAPGVEIQISDNGSGIPEQVISKIFDPFFTTKPVGQGTGLGLSTAYDIIAKHGGRITVESQAGQGTTFHIQLPLKAPPATIKEMA
jgi:two-component system NtrC family sensor kinase